MKILLSALLLTLVFAVAGYGQARSDRDFNNLFGQVQSVRAERARINCDSGQCEEGKRLRSTYYRYDREGNLLLYSDCFDPDNPTARLYRYPFGEQSPLVRRENRAPDGRIIGIEIFSFDNARRQAERLSCDADGSMEQKSVHLFNADGRLVEQTIYDANHQVFNRTTYAYDTRGNELERTDYKGDNTVINVVLFDYEFDEFGNWVKQRMTVKRLTEDGLKSETLAITYRLITYY